VTGASSGIGKEFARQIAASGINIVLVARREDLLKEVGVEFSKRYGVEHRVVVLDVSREDFIGQLASATDDLDIGLVVSNAGTGNPGEFLKLDRQLLQATLRLSTMAHLDITHHFGAKLAKRRRGGLILAGAMGAENGVPCMANDGAAKAYVQSLGDPSQRLATVHSPAVAIFVRVMFRISLASMRTRRRYSAIGSWGRPGSADCADIRVLFLLSMVVLKS
jgi:uncharacterized protein